jgi:lipid A 3-O-deacylase
VLAFRSLFPGVIGAIVVAVPALAGDGLLTGIYLGVLDHNVPILGPQHEHGVDINAEAQFKSFVPDSAVSGIGAGWRWLLQPGPEIGVQANTSGYTSELYFGLAWTVDLDTGGLLWPNHAVFFSFSFGPSFNNGHVHSSHYQYLSLGSNVLFRESLELGYRITPRWSLSVYFSHSSNAGIAQYNAGLDDLGMRVGFHF